MQILGHGFCAAKIPMLTFKLTAVLFWYTLCFQPLANLCYSQRLGKLPVGTFQVHFWTEANQQQSARAHCSEGTGLTIVGGDLKVEILSSPESRQLGK